MKLPKRKSVVAAAAIVLVASAPWVVVTQIDTLPDYINPHYAGAPIATNDWIYLTNRTYTVAFDTNTMNPAWVAYKLEYGGGGVAPPRPYRFKTDHRLPSPVKHDDYTNTGYDRGHMAPSYAIAVRYGKAAQIETFLMSNVIPQTSGMNRGPWRLLEEEVAKDWVKEGPIWVVTGPLYGNQTNTLPTGVRIPEASWKVFIQRPGTNRVPRTLAFIVPQRVLQSDPYTNFVTSVDEVERKTGIDFFSGLTDELECIVEAEDELW